MARKTTYKTVEGLNRALRSLPKEVSAHLRDEAQAIAGDIAKEASRRASRVGGVARYVGPSIKAKRDRVPVVQMGGTKRLPTAGTGWERSRKGSGQTVGDVMYGSEFGGGYRPATRQFMPNTGTEGYYFYPAVRDLGDKALERYSRALAKALDDI